MNIGGAPQTEIDHPRPDRGIGETVDQDEAAHIAIVAIGIEGQRLRQREIAIADFVQRQRLAGQMLQRVDIHLVLQRRYRDRHGGGGQLEQILPARQQFLVRHPEQMGRELVGDLGPRFAASHRTSPREISTSSASVSVTASPATASGRSPSMVTMRATLEVRPGLGDGDGIAGLHAAAGDGAGKAAEIQIGAVDPLHRQAERLVGQRAVDIDRFQMIQQRRALVPGRLLAFGDDIVAMSAPKAESRSGWQNPDSLRKPVKSATIPSKTVCE